MRVAGRAVSQADVDVGETQLSAEALASCQVVAQKIATCAPQAPFQAALFRDLDAAERPRRVRGLLEESRAWQGRMPERR